MINYPDRGAERDPLTDSTGPLTTPPGPGVPAPPPSAGVPAPPPSTGVPTPPPGGPAPTVDPGLMGEAPPGTGVEPELPRERPTTEGSTYTPEGARDTAAGGKEAVASETTQVAHTAKQEARNVASGMKDQARRVVNDAKLKTTERLDTQQKQWSDQLNDVSRDLRQMAATRPDSPAGQLVSQLADRSSMVADYLTTHRVPDVLGDVQAFARRRPGTFLVAMAAAGLVAGRLGRSVATAGGEGDGGDVRVH